MTTFVPAGDDRAETARDLLAKAEKAGMDPSAVAAVESPEPGFQVPAELVKKTSRKSDSK